MKSMLKELIEPFFFHKKKSFLSLIFCFATFSFVCFFPQGTSAEVRIRNSKKGSHVTSLNSAKKTFSIVERNHAIQEENSRYSVHVEYPSIGFIHTDAEIANWARQLVNFFISGLSGIANDDPTHFSLQVKYQRVQPSLQATSFIFYTTTTTGSIAPEHGIVTLSYKNQEGRRLSLEGIFEKTEGLFTFLSNYTRSRLSLRNIEKNDYEKRLLGTSPDPINFSLFALTKEGFTLYFAPNQVASLAEGTIAVDIPLKKVLQFKPDLTLWGKLSSTGKNRRK